MKNRKPNNTAQQDPDSKTPHPRTVLIIVPIVVALIGVAGGYLIADRTEDTGAFRGRQEAVAQLQPTINSLETSVSISRIINSSPTPLVITNTQVITVTQLVVSTPTVDNRVMDIEKVSMNVEAFLYPTNLDSKKYSSRLNIISDEFGDISYRNTFYFPGNSEPDAGAGIVFTFNEEKGIDLSDYEFIEFTISFRGTLPQNCQLYFSDDRFIQSVPCKSPFTEGTGIIGTIDGEYQVVKVPLNKNFDPVNLRITRKVYFLVNPPSSEGVITYDVKNIRLVKADQ
jgi:hypothetical protein